ncbi:sigma factor G inhibitor Gin [Alkalihalobacillus sp. 1P02AB]|uniref:sigma factor G inhibitor Gin n=1 Tax=Alkalihalobacillus sp. 1P02AB TaxID=3132260 RepID=UPI0039A41684
MKKTGVIQLRLGEVCMICEKPQKAGIHVIDSFLCEACERKIINSNTSDLDYSHYLHQMKKIHSHSELN